MQKITKDCKVGIYDNCAYIARIYPDRIVATVPFVRWIGNTGGYAENTYRITNPQVLTSVRDALADGAEESAWIAIGRELDDQYLAAGTQ